MNGQSRVIILTLLLFGNCLCWAQQAGATKRTPTFTTEDVVNPSSPSSSLISEDQITPSVGSGSWVRYSPDGMNLSVELPMEPRHLQMPAIQQLGVDSNSIDMMISKDDRIAVVGLHMVGAKQFTTADLNNIGQTLTNIATMTRNNGVGLDLKYSVQEVSPFKLSINGSAQVKGLATRCKGVAQFRGMDLRLLLVEYPQADAAALVSASRVINSFTIN